MKKLVSGHKHFLMRFVNLCLIIGICFAYQSIASVRAEKEAEIAQKNKETAVAGTKWKDGTYEGSGTGFGGTITVSVSITDGVMEHIEILEASGEDTAYLDNAKKIIQTMTEKQDFNVDVASGATYSSKGIIEAVQNALKEAS
jgi:uncharacterized protein with FMN-binding domain